MGPTGEARVLQIHPTRRCNLRCLHCYSASGPGERDELPAALLRGAIDGAGAAGYTVAAFSGGEPLLYKPLPALLGHARSRGMLTTVTSNGMLLDGRRLPPLRGALDLLAISLDGVPASHNRMRADDRAFAAMAANLDRVRASGIPFGFIFTLTQYNLHELPWVADFALAQGAKLLQIHPLEEAGRARQLLAGEGPDAVEASFAFVVAARLREASAGRLHVQLDLLSRTHLRDHPERVFAGAPPPGPEVTAAELVSPLVIEADGCVVPIQHGFPRAYALGNLKDAPLHELLARWRRDRSVAFRSLCRDVFEELTAPAELPLANWYELLARRAQAAATSRPACS
jgi:MoaA/NifB/PqqE/SkfB family radical SAM enzyme